METTLEAHLKVAGLCKAQVTQTVKAQPVYWLADVDYDITQML